MSRPKRKVQSRFFFGLEIHNPSDVLPRNPYYEDMNRYDENDSPHLFELLTWKTVMTELLFHGEFAGVSYGIPAFPNNIERSEPSRQSKWRMTMMVRLQRLPTVSLRFLGLGMTDVNVRFDDTEITHWKLQWPESPSWHLRLGAVEILCLKLCGSGNSIVSISRKFHSPWSINQHVGWMFLSPLGWACTVPLNIGYRKWSGNVTCNAPSWFIQFQSISPQRPQHGHISCGAICDHVMLLVPAHYAFMHYWVLSKLDIPLWIGGHENSRSRLACFDWIVDACCCHFSGSSAISVWLEVVWMSILFASMTRNLNSIYPSEKQGL